MIDHWDEEAITARGAILFEIARKIWSEPKRARNDSRAVNKVVGVSVLQKNGLPPDGTHCRFSYAGQIFTGLVSDGNLVVNGTSTPFASFSAASSKLTGTSRNGWTDWHLLQPSGDWLPADEWRSQTQSAA